MSESELKKQKGIGEMALNEIKALLAMVGLSLKKDLEKQQYKPTGKTYDITTISQLAQVANKENIGVLMADLADCILWQVNNPSLVLTNFIWTDDGIQGLKKITLIPIKKGGK